MRELNVNCSLALLGSSRSLPGSLKVDRFVSVFFNVLSLYLPWNPLLFSLVTSVFTSCATFVIQTATRIPGGRRGGGGGGGAYISRYTATTTIMISAIRWAAM